jgi:hypothetical protein
VAGPVTCAACGAKVRDDRTQCLRCGAALGVAARGTKRTPAALIAMAAILVVAGLAVMLLTPRSAPPADAAVSP